MLTCHGPAQALEMRRLQTCKTDERSCFERESKHTFLFISILKPSDLLDAAKHFSLS